tara:strand:- start:406 stop:621 length:216 start_codon:yes stop_codon:yes gene_type:complete
MTTRKYLMPMARNTTTGQTIKIQELNGVRYTLDQRPFCQAQAEKLSKNMTERTGDSWLPVIKEYIPSIRKV